ncbi:hypothetical protein CG396_00960, partial [Bifidobacteriaceae bacterium N170]
NNSNDVSNDVSVESSNKRAKTATKVQPATKGDQNDQKVAKPESKSAKKEQSAEAKPEEPAADKEQHAEAKPDEAPAAKTDPADAKPTNTEHTAKTDSATNKTEADQKPDQKPDQSANTETAQPETAQPGNNTSTPKVRSRRSVDESTNGDNKGSSVAPKDEGSIADAGNTENTSAKEPGAEGNAKSSVADRSGEEANGSNNDSNANSQVIKPNEKNQTAESQNEANEQVQTDKKPTATYNLQIRYTIGGAANKQLVQPYELTIDQEDFDKLGKDDKYEYIELPKAAGYRPSVYHSGDYQYYIKNGEGNYVIDNGTDADATRYLRLSKKLITDYAVKQRQVVGGGNGAQAPQNPQNPSSAQTQSEDNGIQHYGELNINYAPKTAKYYVRHLVQDLNNKDEFHDAPNLGIGKVITVKHKDGTTENIHVTEITGTVGSDVTAVSTYIPGYEPENNLISSPLSDSEDEKDKLVLNLRYYRKAYEVTYDSNGGTDVTAQKVYYQQTVPGVTEPTRRGYTFKGWSLVDSNTVNDPSSGLYSDPTVISDKDFKMPDHNVQFRAVWEENKTTNYRVNVWVQKADLVDKEHPKSLVNYDFVGLVERKNVKTGSSVDLKSMNDAGVANDPNKLSGTNKDNPILDSELGLTKEELQGKNSDHKDGLIAKFNWMNDTPVTSLDGYDTTNPGDAENKGKDLFTRYFHVNKKLTKRYTKDPNNTSTKLSANDLDNTFDLVYDRSEYELIFAKPAVLKSSEDAERLNNAAIKRKDKDGKTTIYCYAGGGNCSEKYDEVNEDEDNNTINHKGYRVNVRYGQSLTGIWPDVNELDFGEDTGSLGWRIGYAGETEFRDTPPFRFTKKEFADPKFRVVGNKHKLKISDNPDSDPNNTYELKDNQRLITADTSNKQVMPIQVIIEKQSIASAKKGNDSGNNPGNNPGDDDYVLSTDSYSKDDTSNKEYPHKSSSIAGFNSVDKELHIDKYESDDFDDKLLSDLYSHSIEYEKNGEQDWDDLDDDVKEAFKKKYHVGFRNHLAGGGEDSEEYEENGYLVFKYNRQSYAVQFYNADGKAISSATGTGTGSNDAAKDSLPFEYSLSKRGKKDLKGDDVDLYYNKGAVKSYDASVTKDDIDDTSKQFDGKYTFTLGSTKYSIIRPNDLPKDYVFKGWAVDQAGTHLISAKGKDITVPVNGIKLYAAWGKPEGVKHTVTLNYNMPEIDGNGKEIKDSNVVTKQQFDHYYVIKENKDIKVPTRKGYDFYGWEITKNGTTLPYAFGNKVVEDITLKAVWIKDTRYNGTFKHVFLKPGVTFKQYNDAKTTHTEAAMVDHISTQTVSGLREHLRYNAEAVYSDETHFPDKHFTSFEASSDENQNTGEFVYQTYNTRKYKVRYVDQDGKDLLPESEVSSVNREYDVAFYKHIDGFKPRKLQQSITYITDSDGKQTADIPPITFTYDDVRVLKRKNESQARPTNYTRYVFKVDDNQSSMGSIVDWQGKTVADGSALVYDAISGTKAYQMPLPQDPVAKPGYEFAGWTSKIYIDNGHGSQTESDGFSRLPILSESQSYPKVVYIANFKLKAPVAIETKVLKPTDTLNTTGENAAKDLIK